MAETSVVLVDKVVVPGDVVQQLPPSGAVRIGPGLRAADGAVLAQKAGVLRQTRAGKLWLEGHQRRYLPAEDDPVVGVVLDRRGDNFVVDIGGPFPAQLPQLSFEGATRRNRPALVPGDAVYARVLSAHRDADPVLTCVDAAGRASGFGPLKGGTLAHTDPPTARALLCRPQHLLLAALGAAARFELAVGVNGVLWVDGGGVQVTAAVARTLRGVSGVHVDELASWAAEQAAAVRAAVAAAAAGGGG